ncbi:MAG: hypothetical protein K2M10_00715 [Muribaculaceae bacterium]|nr:hypothetical protein [Muribaculaceae bacterium]
MAESKFDKPFVVIDLGSGRYTIDSEGHEKHNELKNTLTGKFYGYCPPLGNLNIKKLGAKSGEIAVSGVTVIYVKKVPGSSNRVITSYIKDATVYGHPQDGKPLNRLVNTAWGPEYATYSIESDDLVKIEDIPQAEKFIINLKDYNPWMFRMQRFYKGTYPKLDAEIIAYLDSIENR